VEDARATKCLTRVPAMARRVIGEVSREDPSPYLHNKQTPSLAGTGGVLDGDLDVPTCNLIPLLCQS